MKVTLAALLLLALIAVSCGGGGEPLTAADYFAALEDGFDQAEAAMQASGRQFQAVLDDSATTAGARDAAYLVLHRENRAAFAAQRTSLMKLTPPEGLAGEHTEMLEALAVMLAALDGAFANLPEAPAAEETNTALQEAGTSEANGRVMEACRAFTTAAEAHGVSISLPC